MEYIKKVIEERKILTDQNGDGRVFVLMQTVFEPRRKSVYKTEKKDATIISDPHVSVEISLMSGNRFHDNLNEISEHFVSNERDAEDTLLPPEDAREYFDYISNYEIAIEEMKILAREQRR